MGLDNPLHIAFLLVILLLVFGAKRLPELGQSLGAGLRGFKESINGETPATAVGPAEAVDPVAHLAVTSVDATAPSPTARQAGELAVERPGLTRAG